MATKQHETAPDVESEIEKLKAQLEEKEKMLATQKAEAPQEATQQVEQKEELEKREQAEKAVAEIKTAPAKEQKTVSPSMTDADLVKDLQSVMTMDKPQQVKTLIYLAFKKGVRYSFSIAKQLKDPYLLDEFHDTLVDELYQQLLKKRKI
ncbi:MAG: hypothetical protein WC663_02525 [Patescibacteria group bacterium]|jgi:FtsZ-interacting cell division protein ZipA